MDENSTQPLATVPKGANAGTRDSKIASFNTKQAAKAKEPTSLLPQVTQTDKQDLDNEELIKNKAAHTASVRKQEEKAQKEQEAAQEEEAKQANDALKQAAQIAGKVQEGVDNKINPIKDFFARVPTPGGIASMLLILAFFVFAVIPVDQQGHTRLQLLWLTLTGKTHLSYADAVSTIPGIQPAIDAVGGTTQGAGGTFGGKETTNNGLFVPDPSLFQEIDVMGFLMGE